MFNINNMHQIVDGPPDELSKIYDELIAASEHDEFWLPADTLDLDDDDDEDYEDDYPVIVRRSNGCICSDCGETYPFAEPNQDNGSFICYSCRKYG